MSRPTILWIARDANQALWMYNRIPSRDINGEWQTKHPGTTFNWLRLDPDLHPEIKSTDKEPIRVTIRRLPFNKQ